MSESTIHLFAKPVSNINYFYKDKREGSQHLFIIRTYSDGTKKIYRGGASKSGDDSILDVLGGDLHIYKGSYDKKHKVDYVEDLSLLPNILLARGTDGELDAKTKKLDDLQELIEQEGADYKLAIPIKSLVKLNIESQNSNTLARMMVEKMGLKFTLPTYTDSNGVQQEVFAPGSEQNYVTKTLADTAIKDLVKAAEAYESNGLHGAAQLLARRATEMKKIRDAKIEYEEKKKELTSEFQKQYDADMAAFKQEQKDKINEELQKINNEAQNAFDQRCESLKAQKKAELDASCSPATATSSWTEVLHDRKIIHYKCVATFDCSSLKADLEEGKDKKIDDKIDEIYNTIKKEGASKQKDYQDKLDNEKDKLKKEMEKNIENFLNSFSLDDEVPLPSIPSRPALSDLELHARNALARFNGLEIEIDNNGNTIYRNTNPNKKMVMSFGGDSGSSIPRLSFDDFDPRENLTEYNEADRAFNEDL